MLAWLCLWSFVWFKVYFSFDDSSKRAFSCISVFLRKMIKMFLHVCLWDVVKLFLDKTLIFWDSSVLFLAPRIIILSGMKMMRPRHFPWLSSCASHSGGGGLHPCRGQGMLVQSYRGFMCRSVFLEDSFSVFVKLGDGHKTAFWHQCRVQESWRPPYVW